MLRKIILLLCILGIAYYSKQIYDLRNVISLDGKQAQNTQTPAPTSKIEDKQETKMRLKFSMESKDVDLMQACRKIFDKNHDTVSLNMHSANDGRAILKVERTFTGKEMPEALAVRKTLQDQGCLVQGKEEAFSFEKL